MLALMAQGRSSSALSAELCLSGKTIEAHVHVRSIFRKMNRVALQGARRRTTRPSSGDDSPYRSG